MAISDERKRISLAAHMGSADDRTRLDQLNHDGALLSGEIESIEAAIADAQAQIAHAHAVAAMEAEREKRREVVSLADELRGHAEKIDHLWRASGAPTETPRDCPIRRWSAIQASGPICVSARADIGIHWHTIATRSIIGAGRTA
jgi:hypothetical protein